MTCPRCRTKMKVAAHRPHKQEKWRCPKCGKVRMKADMLLTKASSERQQRNRAFAAEFLAPSRGVMKKVSGPVVDAEDIDKLAVEFGVSSQVIRHQVVNHRIAKVL